MYIIKYSANYNIDKYAITYKTYSTHIKIEPLGK